MRHEGHQPGTFLRIHLSDGSFGYGRLLDPPLYAAVYSHRTVTPDSDLDRISTTPILFKIAVRHLALDSWESIGRKELETPLREPIVQFTQDIGNPSRCVIFDTAGNERAAEPQECVGLEEAAVWEQSGVERRLLDALLGRPNAEVERSKVRL
jgi:hypothetical protein